MGAQRIDRNCQATTIFDRNAPTDDRQGAKRGWETLEFRRLGRTDLSCSVIGFGTARIASFGSSLSKSDALRLVDGALDCGINLIDTADIYGQGGAEALLGTALRGKRDRVLLASKVGYSFAVSAGLLAYVKPVLRPILRPLKQVRSLVSKARSHAQTANLLNQDFSPEYLTSAVEGSLRRLKTDHLDILYLHDASLAPARAEATIETLRELQRAGKIRFAGLSSSDEDVYAYAASQDFYSVVQMPLNQSMFENLRSTLENLERSSIGIVVNRTHSGEAPAAADHKAGTIGPADSYQQALASVVMQPGICCALTGTTNIAHLEQNVAGTLSALKSMQEGHRS